QVVRRHEIVHEDLARADALIPANAFGAGNEPETLAQSGRRSLRISQEGDPVEELADLIAEPGARDDRAATRLAHQPAHRSSWLLRGRRGLRAAVARGPAGRKRGERLPREAHSRTERRTAVGHGPPPRRQLLDRLSH